jgi:membrane protein involved in colicin uptake
LYNSYLAKFAENNQYYDQQVQAQQTAKAQAEEEDRQAQIAAQQQAAALAAQQAQAAAKAQATARTKQLNSVLAEAKKRKETSINSAINYLSNQATWGEISDDEYASLISELGITAGQEKAYFTPIPQTGTAAYYYSGRR